VRVHDAIPPRLRTPAGAAVAVAVIFGGSFATAESGENTRASRAVSLLGLAVLVAALWATSRDRKRVRWRPVIAGMLMQYLIALFVLRTRAGYDIFKVRGGEE
jgi:CNT family concentrative nucleoside transporter